MSISHGEACACTRRAFLGLGCGAYVTLALGAASPLTRRAFGAPAIGETVGTEAFARIERIAEGVWAVVSTPQGGRQTISNGGIIAGREGVMVVEGLNTEEGGAWLSRVAQQLTGRRPTHVALTHFHADHSAGLAGHLGGADAPTIVGTPTTRNLLAERYGAAPRAEELKGRLAPDKATAVMPRVVLPDTLVVDALTPTEFDLGGRVVRVTPHSGHTPSDLTVEIREPRVLWCGDLVFNGMFPYYGDAIPSKLGAVCGSILQDSETLYVPGHGSLATAQSLATYLGLLKDVEAAARDAFAKGTPAADAWKRYEPAPALGEWTKFRDNVYQFAFEAWERELQGAR